MPHKLYDCCDSNTCTCGRGERHGISDDRTFYKAADTKLKDLTDDQLEYELKLRKNKKTLEEIARLETRLAELKGKLL